MSMVRIAVFVLFLSAPCIAQTPDDVMKQRAALQAIVAREAQASGLSARLISAIIAVESGWNPWAIHLEPNYRYVRNVANNAQESHITFETERVLQKMAFGLMQLVGGTARAIGYSGPLTRLFDAETNVRWGVRYLRQLKVRYPSVRDQISAYNAGSVRRDASGRYINQAYVDMVTAVLTQKPSGGRHIEKGGKQW